MAYARKVDKAQPAIVKGLRKCGFSVRILSRLNDDGPDLLCGKHFDFQIELKTLVGNKRPEDLLREGQVEFRDNWRGTPVIVAADLEGILFSYEMLASRYRR